MSVLNQVRFEHKGFSHIKITVGTNTIHFDPIEGIQENDIVISTAFVLPESENWGS